MIFWLQHFLSIFIFCHQHHHCFKLLKAFSNLFLFSFWLLPNTISDHHDMSKCLLVMAMSRELSLAAAGRLPHFSPYFHTHTDWHVLTLTFDHECKSESVSSKKIQIKIKLSKCAHTSWWWKMRMRFDVRRRWRRRKKWQIRFKERWDLSMSECLTWSLTVRVYLYCRACSNCGITLSNLFYQTDRLNWHLLTKNISVIEVNNNSLKVIELNWTLFSATLTVSQWHDDCTD